MNVVNNLRNLDFDLIGSAITAMQKFVFVLYIGFIFWNGILFNAVNKYLMPKKPESRWFNFPSLFYSKSPDECETLFQIYTRQHCVRLLFLRDESDLYASASKLTRYAKFHYLVALRSLQLLAPYVFQASLVLIPLTVISLNIWLLKKLFSALGYDNRFARMRGGINLSNTLPQVENVLVLLMGYSAVSFLVCLATTGSTAELTDTCGGPLCLYCYPRLMGTVFKDDIDDIGFYLHGFLKKMLFTSTKLFVTVLFASLLYASTIICVCVGTYMVLDAMFKLWEIFIAFKEHITDPPTHGSLYCAVTGYLKRARDNIVGQNE